MVELLYSFLTFNPVDFSFLSMELSLLLCDFSLLFEPNFSLSGSIGFDGIFKTAYFEFCLFLLGYSYGIKSDSIPVCPFTLKFLVPKLFDRLS